jgi:hypothetical protein
MGCIDDIPLLKTPTGNDFLKIISINKFCLNKKQHNKYKQLTLCINIGWSRLNIVSVDA